MTRKEFRLREGPQFNSLTVNTLAWQARAKACARAKLAQPPLKHPSQSECGAGSLILSLLNTWHTMLVAGVA